MSTKLLSHGGNKCGRRGGIAHSRDELVYAPQMLCCSDPLPDSVNFGNEGVDNARVQTARGSIQNGKIGRNKTISRMSL